MTTNKPQFEISQSPNGWWKVSEWDKWLDSYRRIESFRWRWQARRYVKRLLNIPDTKEYYG